MRLQRYLASCGICSRRSSIEIIEAGRVKVNGRLVREKGFNINEFNDIIELDNKKIFPEKKIYIVLNKPPGYLCSHKDPWKRKTIYDIVKINDIKLFSLGRLDYKSSGLIILTNDGDFANKVTHPSGNIIKKYYMESIDPIPDKLIEDFKRGIKIDDEIYKAVIIKKIFPNKLLIDLHEGKKREIRIVCKVYSVEINILRRISIGNLSMEKLKLNEGEYRFYSLKDINQLIFSGK